MDIFRRLVPFLWPLRKRLGWSIVFGVLVAALWGLDMAVAYPVMLLLGDQTPHQAVEQQIAKADAEISDRSSKLEDLEKEILSLEQQGVSETSHRLIALKERRLIHQAKLTDASRTSYRLTWLRRVVMPWVPRDAFTCFAAVIGLLLLATLIKGVFIYCQDVLVGGVAERVLMQVRKKLFRRILVLDYQTLSSEGTGGLMSRFTYDTEQLATGITLLGGKLVREPLKCLACGGMALWLNWRLTTLALLCIPLLAFTFYTFGRLLKRASRKMMESMSRIYKVLEETFDGIKVVIAFDAAHVHRRQFNDEYRTYYNKAMKLVRIDGFAKPTMEVLGMIAICIAMLPGAYLVMRHETRIFGIRLAESHVGVETLATLYTLLAGMLDPCRKMSSTYSRLKRASAAMERVFVLIDADSRVCDPQQPKNLPRLSQSIEFKDVCFSYQSKHQSDQRGPVLDQFNLKIEAGEVVAIVGHNGCGKSTLVNLLPRFFDPNSGEVYIDGVSLREARLSDIRGQIGVVTQDTVLFDTSIADNIRYGRPNATLEQIEAAAAKAHVLPIVNSLPKRFDSPVGEKGRSLSGGQRQRVALARAILRDPSILILDEATSAADAESEALVHEALKAFAPGRTVLLISHTMSASLLDFVTRIVVMEEGRVLATGGHHELLETCSVYQKLFQSSSRQMGIAPPAEESRRIAA